MTNKPTRANNAQVQIKHGYVYGDGPTNYPVGTKMPDDVKDVVELLEGQVEIADHEAENLPDVDMNESEIYVLFKKAITAITTLSEELESEAYTIDKFLYKSQSALFLEQDRKIKSLSEENASMKAEIEQLKDATPVRKLEGDAKWIATDLIEKIEAKNKEISLLREHIHRTDDAQKMYHNCEQWHDEQCSADESMTVREWVDEPFLKIHRKALKDAPASPIKRG